MDIKQLKKELGLSNKDLAGFFGMSYNAYANSSAKERYEEALCKFYEVVKIKEDNKINDLKEEYKKYTWKFRENSKRKLK